MEPFIGQLMLFGGNFAPRGWATCEGQLLPISQNSALFSLLGTTYGGDGRTTFGLPDLRGRAPIGQGNGPGLNPVTWGERGGTESMTIGTQNLPPHNHTGKVVVNGANGTESTPQTGASLGKPGVTMGRATTDVNAYNNGEPNVILGDGSVQTNNTGGGQSINKRSPYLGMYWCIALQGIYPSRN